MKRSCPICRKPVDLATAPDFPFCSERCRLFDLGNWSSEKYVISEPAFDESMFENLEREMNDFSEPPAPSRGLTHRKQDSDADGSE
jgi:endogenous inhibitor of DNA gyrase (YacG/DUF329 family)